MASLEQRIDAIEARNKRVELDKAWETSWFRKITVSLLTYATVVLFFFTAGLPKPFINSVIPTVAFLISQSTLPIIKRIWLKRQR